MTDKSWELLIKLISVCGYDINQIEDEFDFDELCDDIKNRLARKKQECERSKKRISDLEERIINHSNEVEEYCSRLADKDKECDRYRKALEEIEEYIYTDCEYNDGCDRNICIRCDYSNVHDKKILDIINKAKGEGDV